MGKVIDRNGFWYIKRNPISRVGVFPYLGRQISADCEPDKIYMVLRPKQELSKKETLDSLKLIPLVNEHTMLGEGFTPAEEKGVEGTLGDNIEFDNDTIYADIKIFSEDMKKKIREGKKELSLGYYCVYDKQSGTYNGQRYDYIQKKISGNHLALVDKGRMGSDVRVYDSKDGKDFAMDSIDITMDKDEDIEWVTVNGNHIPVKKGENKQEAVKKFIENKNKESEKGNKTESKVEKTYKKLSEQGLKGEALEQAIYEKHGWEGVEELRKIEKGNKKEDKQTEIPSSFEKGDIMFSKKLNRNYVYLGKNDDGLYIFADNDKFIKNDLNDDDMWLVSEKYLKNNLKDGNMVLAENRSGYEKSEDIDIEKGEYKKNNEEKEEMKEKEKKVAIDEDKRKLIDEIGGMCKEAGMSEEQIRTIIGKAEKIAYNASEATKADDEDEEKKDEKKDEEEKPAKDKCGKDEEKKDEEKKDEAKDEEEDDKKDEEEKKKEIIKEFAKKEKLAKEVEDTLGTFDHSEMTLQEIAEYACDKLELGAEKGQEIATLKGYLKGVEKQKVAVSMKAEDSDFNVVEDKSFDNYLKNAKK